MCLTTAGATTGGTTTLGQPNRISATLQGLTSGLANTAHNIGTALQGLLEQTQNASHF